MSKQLLPLVFLTGFALVSLVPRALADPTEDADRQFLNNLEQHHAPTAAPAATAPTQAAAVTPRPAPITKVTKSPSAKLSDPTTQTTAEVAKTPDPNHQRGAQDPAARKPAEIADHDPAPPVATQRVLILRSTDGDIDHDHDQGEDHEHHHHFFHRLFSRLLGQQHPEDW